MVMNVTMMTMMIMMIMTRNNDEDEMAEKERRMKNIL